MSNPDIIVVEVPQPVQSVKINIPGITGSPGEDGEDGDDGDDGISIIDATIDGAGHLILTFSPGGPVDLGKITGNDGNDGVSITGASIDGSGHLILTFSSGGPADLGKVTGNNGSDGVSITGATVDGSYHLILTLSSGGPLDAGYVRGPAGAGTGDVVGPAGTTTGFFATFADATGKLLAAVSAATVKAALALVKGDVGLGNVDNTSDVDKPVSTAQQNALNLKANLAGATFSGPVNVTTQAAGNNTTLAASTAFVTGAIATLINSAPGLLDTLDEIAAALNDDPNFAATMTTALAGKQGLNAHLTALAGTTFAADKVWFATGASTFSTMTVTSQARQLLDDTSFADMLTTLGAASVTYVNGKVNNGTVWSGTVSTTIAPSEQAVQALSGSLTDYIDNGLANKVDLTGAQTLTDKTIERPTITNGYTEERAVYNSGTTANIDLSAGSIHYVTLTGNWTPSAIPVATAGRGFIVFVKQDATGGRTITWPSNVKWPGGVAPVLTATASKADKIAFQCIDGTNWHANVVGQNYEAA